MKTCLDDVDYINSIDGSGMLREISRFPSNAEQAIKDALKVDLGESSDFNSVVISGMGGSAVGGLLLSDWLLYTSETPIHVSRDYQLPRWVNEDTLVFAVSYSGNTEETLSQYHEAMERGCRVICFCSGGELEKHAHRDGNPVIKFPQGIQPRAAIPYQFFSLAAVSKNLGLFPLKKWEEVWETIQVTKVLCESMGVESSREGNRSKQLAEMIHMRTPFIYGSRMFQAVAYRYSTQFNENSKTPAASSFFPEMFHNSVMAREGSKDVLGGIIAVIIRHPFEGIRLRRKIDATRDLLSEKFGLVVEVEAVGESDLARMMSVLLIGDYTSAYLGVLYGVDPGTTDSIAKLKAIMG